MILNNIKEMKRDRGFTIVELLIVIVIIAVLAAITIVAYNGITQRANTASAQSAAKNALSKMEAYNADSTVKTYPATPGALTGSGANGTTYQLTGVTFNTGATAATTAPANPNVLNFYACTTGAAVSYYKYDGTPGWTAVFTGGGTTLAGAGCNYVQAT